MDNRKIGKLIASLRKQQGLTQQDLGDKVGVGFRAVSKWERGLTLPDITIINELSKILGISSDELLKGEIDKSKKIKVKKKKTSKSKITISILIMIIAITMLFILLYIFNNGNNSYIYNIKSTNKNYYVEGQVAFEKRQMSLMVNKLRFKEEDFGSIKIKNYEYKIFVGEEFIYGFGYSLNGESMEGISTIKDFTERFKISYSDEIWFDRKEVLENNIDVIITFMDENGNEIRNDIEISLYLPNISNN